MGQLKLFFSLPPQNRTSKLHRAMLRFYGDGPTGKTCGQCRHLYKRTDVARNCWKCELSLVTRGPASDFRKKWLACGAYEDKMLCDVDGIDAVLDNPNLG